MITNKLNLPRGIVEAVKNDPYPHSEVGDYSVTSLLSPPRQLALKRQHEDLIVEDAADRIWALLGQSTHTLLERAVTAPAASEGLPGQSPTSLLSKAMATVSRVVDKSEQRLYASIQIDGRAIDISGQYDSMIFDTEENHRALQDYKVTSAWSVVMGDRIEEWEQQLNILAWLAQHNGEPVDALEIIAILRDWSKMEARRKADYPRHQVYRIEIPMWETHEQYEFIIERIKLHENAKKNLPLCSDREMWARPTTYACKKKNAQRASRVFDNSNDAHYWIEKKGPRNFYVEVRPGARVRCDAYCSVAPFCSQYQEWKDQEDESF